MEFLNEYRLSGLFIGICTFLIIGLFHPVVIKAEYSIGLLNANSYTYTDANGAARTGHYNNEPAISIGIAYSGLFTR